MIYNIESTNQVEDYTFSRTDRSLISRKDDHTFPKRVPTKVARIQIKDHDRSHPPAHLKQVGILLIQTDRGVVKEEKMTK